MIKTNIAVIAALVTLIGSILIGGITFGDVRGATAANARAITEQRERFNGLEINMREISNRTIEIANDLKWLKERLK